MPTSNPKNNQVSLISKVKPYNTLFFGPMPCEHKAAAIRNKTVDSMTINDTADVAYRYLQSRRGENNTLKEAVFWGCLSITMFGMTTVFRVVSRSPRAIPLLFLSTLPALHIPPNIGNTIRYRETKKSSEEWLRKKIEKDKLAEIQSFKFNQQGMYSLNAFVERERLDGASIKYRTKREDSVFSCWDMDR